MNGYGSPLNHTVSDKLKVAITGCGRRYASDSINNVGFAIAHLHATGWQQCGEDVELHGVDVAPDNLAFFGEKFGVPAERLFSSTKALYEALTPDVVSVVTWPELQAEMVSEAAAKGVRGIICEKPVATNILEIQKIREACKASDVKLAIAHQRRLSPEWVEAKKLLHSGAIGDKWMAEASVDGGWDMLSWTTHWFDMVNFLYDARPVSNLAGLDHTSVRRYGHAVENSVVVHVEYPANNGAVFINVENSPFCGIAIRGSNGLLQCEETKLTIYDASGRREIKAEELPDTGRLPWFQGLARGMVDALATGRPMPCDGAQTTLATEMAFLAMESARSHRRIRLDEPCEILFSPLEALQHSARPYLPPGKIVFHADEHFGGRGREGLVRAFKEHFGADLELIEVEKELTDADLAGAGLLLISHTDGLYPREGDATEETKKTLTQWVESGSPTILIHGALGAYPPWEQFRRWAGRAWIQGASSHPHGEVQLSVVAGAGYSPGWQSAWLPKDEVYTNLGATGKVRDLAWMDADFGRHPAVWVNAEWPNVGSLGSGSSWRRMVPARRAQRSGRIDSAGERSRQIAAH